MFSSIVIAFCSFHIHSNRDGRSEPFDALREIIHGVAGLYKKALAEKTGDGELANVPLHEVKRGRLVVQRIGKERKGPRQGGPRRDYSSQPHPDRIKTETASLLKLLETHHHDESSLSSGDREKAERLRNELDGRVADESARIVGEAKKRHGRGEGESEFGTISTSSLPKTKATDARGQGEDLQRQSVLPPLPDEIKQSGWMTKQIKSLFGDSSHERFYTLLGNDRLLYFPSEIKAREFFAEWENLEDIYKKEDMIARHNKQIDLIAAVAVDDLVDGDGQ